MWEGSTQGWCGYGLSCSIAGGCGVAGARRMKELEKGRPQGEGNEESFDYASPIFFPIATKPGFDPIISSSNSTPTKSFCADTLCYTNPEITENIVLKNH